MKQLAQYQNGRLELQEVPVPKAPAGGILVSLTQSVISAGTEKMKVEQARMNLFQKARARPDQVRKVLDTARTLGWRSAMDKVRNRLESPSPLGYSAAGRVEAVDEANTRFRVGDRVACGGAECAFHAEWVAIPDFLAARIPDGVENWQAAYTTIVSIALQTVRQLEPRLGERVLVLGQGLVGLLVTNLLAANGCRVMAVDVMESRRAVATTLGAERVVIVGSENLSDEVRAWSEGFGVDGVILATASASNTPTEQAIDSARDRGRIVVVGNTHVELPWKAAYEKELEVRYSRSYGPGRYDPAYEWGGSDYPAGYVRWTEQRNFDACLHLMKTGALRLDAITTRRVRFADCLQVYRELAAGSPEIGVVIEYDKATTPSGEQGRGSRKEEAGRLEQEPTSGRKGTERRGRAVAAVDVIGAGNFARTMLLPHLHNRIALGTVVNHTSLSAQHVKSKFGFAVAGTDAAALLSPAEVHSAASQSNLSSGQPDSVPLSGLTDQAVLIATRHHLHAPLVVAALGQGRDVFVEKPLCLTRDELRQIDAAMAASQGSLQVGFNRRFAPATVELKRLISAAPGPKSASFRVMAGKLDPGHWYANYAESGGRVLGEGCHFLDFFCFLFGAPPVRVSAQTTWPPGGRLPFPDSVTAQIEFADGSSGQLIYTAEGDASWPKEVCTVFGAGFVAELENFQRLITRRGRRESRRNFSGKGHAEQIAAWVDYLLNRSAHPLSYAESRQSMLLTFATLDAIRSGKTVEIPRVPEGTAPPEDS